MKKQAWIETFYFLINLIFAVSLLSLAVKWYSFSLTTCQDKLGCVGVGLTLIAVILGVFGNNILQQAYRLLITEK